MIQTYTCKNGLRIVLEKVPAVRSATIGIWVYAGSRHEKKQVNGISHFLEHMLFKGTKTRTAHEIAKAFDVIGGNVNAFTSKEYTCYYARVLDEKVEDAFDILTDMLFHSTFVTDELEREKKVVMEEIHMYEDTPDDHIHDILATAAFGEHPLGRSIIGMKENIESFQQDTLFTYMDEHYVPENIVVSVAGNVDEKMIDVIERSFSHLQPKKVERTIEQPSFVAQSVHKTKETEQAHVCFAFPGLPADDPYLPSLLILNSVLGGGMSSRLFQEIREKRGLAYAVYSYHSSYIDSGLFTIYAGTNKEQLPILEETIHGTIASLLEDGLTNEELENNKEKIKGNITLSMESTSSRMSRNGRNTLLLNKQRSLQEMIADIERVDQASIRHVMQQTLQHDYARAVISPK
ncbi:MAG TPA: pitrilysin family protein [Pseudogracilibacillus sp.]|nr:pitrilysin family protein [Pseudogracilibacillus sp.]